MKEDVLYHLALGSGSHDLEKMFGDVKYVCMGGTPQRMKTFAGKTKPPFESQYLSNILILTEHMLTTLGYVLPTGTCLIDISERSHRCGNCDQKNKFKFCTSLTFESVK